MWRAFIRAQASHIVATDLFSVYAVLLHWLNVLFFLELCRRRILDHRRHRPPQWATGSPRRRGT
jgi:hypothetical protein